MLWIYNKTGRPFTKRQLKFLAQPQVLAFLELTDELIEDGDSEITSRISVQKINCDLGDQLYNLNFGIDFA